MDYGSIGQSQFFEAVLKADAPLRLTTGMADRLMAHATRFLSGQWHRVGQARHDTSDVQSNEGYPRVHRPLRVGFYTARSTKPSSMRSRPTWPPGLCAITIAGPPGFGVRTLRSIAARGNASARIRIRPRRDVRRFPWLARSPGRSSCLPVGRCDLAERRPSRIAAGSTWAHGARRHVLLMFGCLGNQLILTKRVPVERMGVAAMTGMVFVDCEQGPMPDDVFSCRTAGRRTARTVHRAPGSWI